MSFSTLDPASKNLIYQYAGRGLSLAEAIPEDRALCCQARLQEIHSFPAGSFIQKMGGDIRKWTSRHPIRNFQRVERFEKRVVRFIEQGIFVLGPEERAGIDLDTTESCNLAEINECGLRITSKRDRALLEFFEWFQDQPGPDQMAAQEFWLGAPALGKADAVRDWLLDHHPLIPEIPELVIYSWPLVPLEFIGLDHEMGNRSKMVEKIKTTNDLQAFLEILDSPDFRRYHSLGSCMYHFLRSANVRRNEKMFTSILQRKKALLTVIKRSWEDNFLKLLVSDLIKEDDLKSFQLLSESGVLRDFLRIFSHVAFCFIEACYQGRVDFVKYFFPLLKPFNDRPGFGSGFRCLDSYEIKKAIERAFGKDAEMVRFLSPRVSTTMLWEIVRKDLGERAILSVVTFLFNSSFGQISNYLDLYLNHAENRIVSSTGIFSNSLLLGLVGSAAYWGVSPLLIHPAKTAALVAAIQELGRRVWSHLRR